MLDDRVLGWMIRIDDVEETVHSFQGQVSETLIDYFPLTITSHRSMKKNASDHVFSNAKKYFQVKRLFSTMLPPVVNLKQFDQINVENL